MCTIWDKLYFIFLWVVERHQLCVKDYKEDDDDGERYIMRQQKLLMWDRKNWIFLSACSLLAHVDTSVGCVNLGREKDNTK